MDELRRDASISGRQADKRALEAKLAARREKYMQGSLELRKAHLAILDQAAEQLRAKVR